MSRIYVQQKRPGVKAAEPSYSVPAVHAPSLTSGQSGSDLDALMQAKYRQHFLDNQIPTAEAEADRIAASVSGARTPEDVKTQLGEKMGADFSNVTFHTDSAALKQADAMGARAYTTGSDVYFGSGGFDPGVAAHELVHTVQQGMVGSAMQTTSAPTGGVQMKLRRRREAKGTSSSKFLRDSMFGSFDSRQIRSSAPDEFIDKNARSYSFDEFRLEGRGIGGSDLKGMKFNPTGRASNGKSVIVYAGTHTNGLDQMKTAIKQYTDQGFTVYQMDYRGYGENAGNSDEDFQVSEQSLNEDAHALFEHVQRDQGENKTNNDIILHGFSMGGAVASRLAADISEQAAASGDNTQKLGGLTLHSSMRNLKHAARNSVGKLFGPLAGWISERHLGRFSTKHALQDIAKADQTLPINLISGGKDDGLNLKSTKLEKVAQKAGLQDVTAAQGNGAHLKNGTAPVEHFGNRYYNQLKRNKKLWNPRQNF